MPKYLFEQFEEFTKSVFNDKSQTPAPEQAVQQRLATVFSFLEKAGLNQALDEHAKKNDVDPNEYTDLLNPYIKMQTKKLNAAI